MSVTHLNSPYPTTGQSVPRPCMHILPAGGWAVQTLFLARLIFVEAAALDVPPCVCCGMFTYLPYLVHLAGPASLSCFEFSLKLNSSYFPPTEERLASQRANAHLLSRRRLQLTIVGFHHAHECTASMVMACQSIFSPHYLPASLSFP